MDDKDIGFALSVRSDDLSPQASDYIRRLEAVVRAALLDESDISEAPIHLDNPEAHAWVSGWNSYREKVKDAVSRVNLAESPNSSVNPATLTSQSQTEGVDGKGASDGKA